MLETPSSVRQVAKRKESLVPIVIPQNLPATETLQRENIFVMHTQRAYSQDIRPLKILLVNLMPTKEATEFQICRLIGNTPLQVELTLLRTASYEAKNSTAQHLNSFYKTFEEVRHTNFDGMIVTGAPVEHLEFKEVAYWQELTQIMEYAAHHVTSSLFICWGAQAGLYHYYGIPKYPLGAKCFGIFSHALVCDKPLPLFRGFDDSFLIPHSRHTELRESDIAACPQLQVLASSKEAGVAIVANQDLSRIFCTGHLEYTRETLEQEFLRDKAKGLDLAVPHNYFVADNPSLGVAFQWQAHAHLLFANWINYCVYQTTPFDEKAILH